jgi:hypothetical protein
MKDNSCLAANVKATIVPVNYLILGGEKALAKSIFTIGPSTVRYDNNLPGDIGANHSQYPVRVGWGTELQHYLRPQHFASNQGRRFATAESYQTETVEKGPAYWGTTKTMIENTAPEERGFLLIQFGGTDHTVNTSEEDFKTNLRFYIDQAIALQITPVLVTSVESRTTGPNGTRGNFPRYVREVAAEKQTLLLDLHAKSLEKYLEQTTENLGYRFGNAPYIRIGSGNFFRIDNTHFEARGARIVAGWVKELACDLQNQSLCQLFDPKVQIETKSYYSHSEYLDDPSDPELNGWYIAAANGILNQDKTNNDIAIVYDDELGSNVLNLTAHPDTDFLVHGDRNQNGSRTWANKEETILQWKMRTSQEFRIYVEVSTSAGNLHLTYKPLDVDEGPGQNFPEYVRFGLGEAANDGTWKTFTRDLAADVNQFLPGEEIIQVNGFRFKGIARFDDLSLSNTNM